MSRPRNGEGRNPKAEIRNPNERRPIPEGSEDAPFALTPAPLRRERGALLAFWWALGLSAWQFFGGSAQAQPATNFASPSQPPAPAARTNKAALMVAPMPPVSKPPVEFFHELLAMTVAERNQALSNRTPEDRKLILAKVREYKAIPPDQRELRLQATELSWYLTRLMRLPGTNRLAQLETVPSSTRKLVGDRLEVWDKLQPEVRRDFLEKRMAIQDFVELAGSSKQPATTNLSPARRAALTNGISQIQAMPEDQRQKLLSRFNQFFELTPQEKQRVLNSISEPERQQMEKTLRSFGALTPAQRRQCIRSFEKFAGLSVEERNQFLKNAERWKLMTPDQRQTWREVVAMVPILPATGLDSPTIPKPPVPQRRAAPVPTNGN